MITYNAEDEARAKLRAEYRDAMGPGKFQGNIAPMAAAYVHDITLNGFQAEECGTIEYGPGWYGLVYFDVTQQRDVIWLGWERDTDASPESSPVAAIVHNNDQGFVMVTFYDSEEAAQADFGEAQGVYDMLDAMDEDDDG